MHSRGANVIPLRGRSLRRGRGAFGSDDISQVRRWAFCPFGGIWSSCLVSSYPGMAGGRRHPNYRGGCVYDQLFFRLLELSVATSTADTGLKTKGTLVCIHACSHTIASRPHTICCAASSGACTSVLWRITLGLRPLALDGP